jgi:hypothetical protein
VFNTKNKLTYVKPIIPNLPVNINITYYKRYNIPLLKKICAESISLSQLEQLTEEKYAALTLLTKSDIAGNLLEISFFY